MASFGDGKIEAYVGPLELGAADNLEQVIVDFIGGAKKTLDIAIQEIDSRTIAPPDSNSSGRSARSRSICSRLSASTTSIRLAFWPGITSPTPTDTAA